MFYIQIYLNVQFVHTSSLQRALRLLLPYRGLAEKKKKIAAKIHSWQRHIFFFSIFNMLPPMKIMPSLQMNKRRLLIHWLSSYYKVTYLCQFFLDMLVQFLPSLNKTWGVNFTLEIYLISVRGIFPSKRYYLWDWVRFHAEKRIKEP